MEKILFLLLLGLNNLIYAQENQEFPVLKGEYLGQKPPGIIPEVFAPGIVSDTSLWEHCQVAVSPRGDEIYWSAWTPKYPPLDPKYTETEQIFYSKLENGTWTKPALAEFVKDFLTTYNGGPVFSLDGNKLFFYSLRPDGLGDLDTYYVEKTDGKWSKPINVGKPYNSAGTDLTPAFNAQGSAYKNFQNTIKYKYENGVFSNPDTIVINKDFSLRFPPYVSPNESYIIFSANKAGGFGSLDLYISFKNSKNQWGYPINMGDKINTSEAERFPVVSPDGKYLFFLRHTETQDFFWLSTAILDVLKKQSIDK
ncbi:MAG: hypothetical protein EHM93_00960 [Bacteroidales bacterium]|nr:MAG: hypothetical protein EHM93_00960 [Bacteroidales bacterium]